MGDTTYLELPLPAGLQYVSKTLDPANAEASALGILTAFDASWEETKDQIKLKKFTGGWTNTLLKAKRNIPGKSKAQIEADAILVRGYGVGTDTFIDRENEIKAHCQLSKYGLAPQLIARFENGLLYRFVPGTTCKAEDIRTANVSRAIAKELGQWHSRLPLSALISNSNEHDTKLHIEEPKRSNPRPYPNVWTSMQRWLDDLPASSQEEKQRNQILQRELSSLCEQFVDAPGLCGKDYVFTHGDLHDANVIIQEPTPRDMESTVEETELKAVFIDYEYCMPAPPAFELAYHFSEWAGFDCEYRFIPTRSERRRFIESYVRAFHEHAKEARDDAKALVDVECKEADVERDVKFLEQQVDAFRGVPGMYWGLWALMQIHRTGEDYSGFYETKIKEYWDWKGEGDGSRKESGKERSLRERRWMEE